MTTHTRTLKQLDFDRDELDRFNSRMHVLASEHNTTWNPTDLGGGFGDTTSLHDNTMDWDYYELGGTFGDSTSLADTLGSDTSTTIEENLSNTLSDFKITDYSSQIAFGANQLGKALQKTNFGPRASAYAVAESSQISAVAQEALSNTQEPWQATNVQRWENSAMSALGKAQAENQNKLIDYNENVDMFDSVLDIGYIVAPLLGPEAELAYTGFDLMTKALFSPSKPEMSTVDLSRIDDNSVTTHGSFFNVDTPHDIAKSIQEP